MKKYVARVLLWSALLTPFVYTATLIITGGINMPYADEWSLVPVFSALHNHHLGLALKLLWHQHNEHRVFFPNLFSVIVGHFTHWNTHIEMLINILIVFCSFLIFSWYIVRSARSKPAMIVVLLITSLVLFSPDQWENWLWGWQIEWYFCIIFGLAALAALDKKFTRLNKNVAYVLAAICCFIASFSLGNGLFFWLVCLIPLIANKCSRQTILLWITGFLGSLYLYLYRYSPLPGDHMHLTMLNYVQFFFAYIGGVLSQEIGAAVTIGVILVALTGLLLYKVIKLDRLPLSSFTLPLGLIGFVIISDLITLHSRINIFGIDGALASRYISVSTLYLVALLLIMIRLKAQPLQWLALAVIIGPFIIGGYISGHAALKTHASYFKGLKACLILPRPPDSCILQTYPAADKGRIYLNYLKQTHMGGF